MEQACLDGAVMPAGEARVPATDEGVLRGDGVFEVIRVYDGRPFALEDHLARLERSAANLRLAIDVEAVRRDVSALLAAKPGHDGVLRLVLTRGGRRLALTEPLPDRPPLARLATVTYAPTRILDGVKSLSYAANMLATRVAVDRGFDDALLVTPHGRVLEAPTSSFFWVRDGELLTPPLDDHILASITRARVIELTGAREAVCPLDELDAAQEAFVASTVREVMPVGAIDDRELPTLGPRTRDAARLLRERIDAELQAALP
jgi:branched-chain amino acid aminotransferase